MYYSNIDLREIDYETHINETIIDILMTPKGTRIYKKKYGSHLHEYIDDPIRNKRKIIAEVGESLTTQITDYVVKKVAVSSENEIIKIRVIGEIPSLKRKTEVGYRYVKKKN